ncbi:MAG: polysaccharide deacetylase family protein [Hungateiclostridium thermocellum]|nr:polysaccharide deacetylase family protein [Acetivibrio thermocellus]
MSKSKKLYLCIMLIVIGILIIIIYPEVIKKKYNEKETLESLIAAYKSKTDKESTDDNINIWVPTNYMNNIGTLIENTFLIEDWLIPKSELMSIELVTDVKLYESGCVMLTIIPENWNSATLKINYDFSNVNKIAIALYVEDQYSLDYIKIQLTSELSKANAENNWTKYFETNNIYTSERLHTGWNFIIFHKNDFSNVGGDTWGVFRAFRIVSGVTSNKFDNAFGEANGEAVTKTKIGIGGIYLNPEHEKTKLLLSFDDSQGSLFTNGFPYMKENGIKATLYVCRNHVSDITPEEGYMSPEQHDEWYAAGYDIGCHSTTHEDMWYKTRDELINEWDTVLKWVLKRGYERSAYFAAYPNAQYNGLEMEVLRELGFKMARGRNIGLIDHIVSDEMLGYPTYEIKNTTTLETIKGWIDEAIEKNSDISIFTHAIVVSNPDTFSTTTEIFYKMIDYIAEKRALGLLEPVTISEYYEGLTNKTITIPNINITPAD